MTFQNEEDFRRCVAQGLHERLAQKCVVLDSKNVIALWTEGPRELLQHAADHLRLGADFDRRIAMISVDNPVELATKTYLGLPERARGTKGPGRRALDTASESFPSLLDMLRINLPA